MESRIFTRVPVRVKAELNFENDKQVISEKTKDLSMRGVFVETDAVEGKDSVCDVSLILEGSEEPVQVKVKGRVIRSGNEGMAIEFTEIQLESYDHLKKLVMYNSSDAQKIEQENKVNSGIKPGH